MSLVTISDILNSNPIWSQVNMHSIQVLKKREYDPEDTETLLAAFRVIFYHQEDPWSRK